MAMYDAGTASLAADGTVTGVGTTWRQPLTLIRVGATMIFNTSPISIVTIAEILSDTSIRAFNDKGFVAPAGTQYFILAHDGITVQGLAQDVAETLRYYQSQETKVSSLVELAESGDFDFDKLQRLVNEAKASETNAASSASAASASQQAAATSKAQAESSASSAQKAYNNTVDVIANAGDAGTLVTLAGYGIATNQSPSIQSFDWQNVDLISGAAYSIRYILMSNVPTGVKFGTKSPFLFLNVVNARYVSGNVTAKVQVSTRSDNDLNTRVYDVYVTGTNGSRTFYVRENLSLVSDSSSVDGGATSQRIRNRLDVYSKSEVDATRAIAKGGTGATTAAGARTNLDVFSKSEVLAKGYANVKDFGATLDGTLKPLSQFYSTLAEAKSVYPFVTSLTQSVDYAAIQAAINTGRTVYIPYGFAFVNSTIYIGNSTKIIGEGNPQINRAQTFISVDGNISLFALTQGSSSNVRMYQVEIDGLYIFYNDGSTPLTPSGNDNKKAFNFYSTEMSTTGLENSLIKNCTVHGGWACYTDTTGTYQTKLENVWARNCHNGFIKATGTTMLLETCYASGCVSPFEFGSVMSVTLLNCAMDASSISSSGGSYGGAGLHFVNSHSVNILGMDVEGNIITTDGGVNCTLFHFNNSNGKISGLTSWQNQLRTSGSGAGGVVSFIKASGTSHVIIDSSEDEISDSGLVYNGSGGYPVTIYSADETSRIDVLSGRFQSAKGGSPGISVASQGVVNWFTRPMSGQVVGGYAQSASVNGLTSPGFRTGTGVTAASAGVSTGLFELPNMAGMYLVSCWVTGAGPNYSVIANVLFDGSQSSITVTKTGAFTAMNVSGRTVGITAQGAATYQWSYTKLS